MNKDLSKMSSKEVINGHLQDYAVLLKQLLQSLAAQGATRSHVVSQLFPGGADPLSADGLGTSANSAAVLDSLLQKDHLLQAAVDRLVLEQRLQARVAKMKALIAQADEVIINFASRLGEIEQTLHDAVTDTKTLKNPDGMATKQSFSVDEVLVFSERLALMSFAPADYIEKRGMSLCRPPAPLENLMAHSRLHLSVDEMLAASQAGFNPANPGAGMLASSTANANANANAGAGGANNAMDTSADGSGAAKSGMRGGEFKAGAPPVAAARPPHALAPLASPGTANSSQQQQQPQQRESKRSTNNSSSNSNSSSSNSQHAAAHAMEREMPAMGLGLALGDMDLNLADLKMPDGWKPGDPIPMEHLAALTASMQPASFGFGGGGGGGGSFGMDNSSSSNSNSSSNAGFGSSAHLDLGFSAASAAAPHGKNAAAAGKSNNNSNSSSSNNANAPAQQQQEASAMDDDFDEDAIGDIDEAELSGGDDDD